MLESLPYGRQTVTYEDIEEVVGVLNSAYLTQGHVVPEFEDEVAQCVDARYGVAVNSATSALHLGCLALGVKPGDIIWTSPISFVASANCGRYCGAEVDFVDIEPTTGLMDINSLSKKLRTAQVEGMLPKVLIPVHLCGTSCAMEEISDLAHHFGVRLIEDASHAIGGSYKDRPVGNCRYSDITVFSFHAVKIITTGEGGLATTNNAKLAELMRDLRSHGITKDRAKFVNRAAGPWSYEQHSLGFNYRMTEIQAALGRSQLRRLEKVVSERQRQLGRYRELLADLPVQILEIPKDCLTSGHLAVIRLNESNAAHHRYVFEGLRDAGIGVQVHYTPIHLQPYYQKLGFAEGDFPAAEAYARSVISLPLFPGLKEQDLLRVAGVLQELLS